MLYTDAFKGTVYLYVGEGFSGGEDALFAVMEVSPSLSPPFILQCKLTNITHTHTHAQTRTCNCVVAGQKTQHSMQ